MHMDKIGRSVSQDFTFKAEMQMSVWIRTHFQKVNSDLSNPKQTRKTPQTQEIYIEK